MRWSVGEPTVERLIAEGRIEAVTGAKANGLPWLERAQRTLDTAAELVDRDASSCFVLAYDAVRQACVGLLTQQGLRPTTAGGHYAVEELIRAQFGSKFRDFGSLRRRRNELEYPTYPDEEATSEEAAAGIETARELVGNAALLLPNLGIF